MHLKAILYAGVALLVAQGASAQSTPVPAISGNYMMSINSFCGLPADPWPDGVTTQFDGSAGAAVFNAFFYSTPHTTSYAEFSDSTQAIVPNSTGGSTAQNSFTTPKRVSYSNTATTFTFNGQTYQVVYGTVTNGIVQQFQFTATSTQGSVSAANCVNSGTAIRI